jgi:hypothetical protein
MTCAILHDELRMREQYSLRDPRFRGYLHACDLSWVVRRGVGRWLRAREEAISVAGSLPVCQSTMVVLAIATTLGFISILWLHSAAAAAVEMLKFGFSGLVDGKVGLVSMPSVWIGVFCTVVSLIYIVVMVSSIRLLDRLTHEDEW